MKIDIKKYGYESFLETIYYNLSDASPRMIFGDKLMENDDLFWWGELIVKYWLNNNQDTPRNYIIRKGHYRSNPDYVTSHYVKSAVIFTPEPKIIELYDEYKEQINQQKWPRKLFPNIATKMGLLLFWPQWYKILNVKIEIISIIGSNNKTNALHSTAKYFAYLGVNSNKLLGVVL